MLKIDLSKQAQKFLKTIPDKHAKQVARKLISMQVDPRPNDAKKLVGSSFLRVDSGEYRIIYQVNTESILEIVVIGKRNDDEVYRQFKSIYKK